MTNHSNQLIMLPAFQKFITASATGRRLMPSGKKLRAGTICQYQCVLKLLQQFESLQDAPIRIQVLQRVSLRLLQKEKNYWSRFFRQFSLFLYKTKGCFDEYVAAVFKVIKTFFHYLSQEKALPVGEFHKKFRVPSAKFNPVILSPIQLKFLITSREFEDTLSPTLKRVKDIFVFGCTVALRYQDLLGLQKKNIQYAGEEVNIILHTQKTGTAIKIPLPAYALQIIDRYKRKAGRFVLPRLSCTNINLGIKALIKKAGWDYSLPKIRYRQGQAVELTNNKGQNCRFYDHITAHTMRRTAITTLLLLGVDEHSVRLISGHAPGSKEFYRYVVVVQEYLNAKVKAAHLLLVSNSEMQ